MAGVTSDGRSPRRALKVMTPTLLAVLAGVSGCAVREPCFQVVAVTPASGEAMVFDACKGAFGVIQVPPPTKRSAPKTDL